MTYYSKKHNFTSKIFDFAYNEHQIFYMGSSHNVVLYLLKSYDDNRISIYRSNSDRIKHFTCHDSKLYISQKNKLIVWDDDEYRITKDIDINIPANESWLDKFCVSGDKIICNCNTGLIMLDSSLSVIKTYKQFNNYSCSINNIYTNNENSLFVEVRGEEITMLMEIIDDGCINIKSLNVSTSNVNMRGDVFCIDNTNSLNIINLLGQYYETEFYDKLNGNTCLRFNKFDNKFGCINDKNKELWIYNF